MKLSKSQINNYLKEILKIEKWEITFNSDEVELLKLIVLKQVTEVYFHNLHIASIPLSERRVPNEEDIIGINLRGEGGNCLHLNYFMRILLESIGYKVLTVAGTIGFQRNHVLNIITLNNGLKYLVDVACGCPVHEPIPLDTLPYTTKSVAGTLNEYRKISDNEYVKVQIGGGFFRKELANGEIEKILISFDTIPVELEFFEPGMTQVWKDEEISPFCRNLFLFRHYFSPVEDTEEVLSEQVEGAVLKFILIFGKHVLIGSETQRKIQSFPSYEEMIPIILKYFPKVKEEILVKAIKYLNTVQPIEIRF